MISVCPTRNWHIEHHPSMVSRVDSLFNVASGGDGRAVIGEDFDRDGRVDLLVANQYHRFTP